MHYLESSAIWSVSRKRTKRHSLNVTFWVDSKKTDVMLIHKSCRHRRVCQVILTWLFVWLILLFSLVFLITKICKRIISSASLLQRILLLFYLDKNMASALIASGTLSPIRCNISALLLNPWSGLLSPLNVNYPIRSEIRKWG